MRRRILTQIAALWLGTSVTAGGQAGEFDYYVLSLSWSPSWCALEGAAKGDPQCSPGSERGWVLHGLWPQYEEGWPDYCPTTARAPSRNETGAMADIMGSSASAWHQWRKHGVCSGLDAADYFTLAREAFVAVAKPPLLDRLEVAVTLPARLIEEAFLEVNPGLQADGITVTCKAGRIQEVRLCLSRDLDPRVCGNDVVKDCDSMSAEFPPNSSQPPETDG